MVIKMNEFELFESSDEKVWYEENTKEVLVNKIAEAMDSGVVFFDLKTEFVYTDANDVFNAAKMGSIGYGRYKKTVKECSVYDPYRRIDQCDGCFHSGDCEDEDE